MYQHVQNFIYYSAAQEKGRLSQTESEEDEEEEKKGKKKNLKEGKKKKGKAEEDKKKKKQKSSKAEPVLSQIASMLPVPQEVSGCHSSAIVL
jgi:hypothetical protein